MIATLILVMIMMIQQNLLNWQCHHHDKVEIAVPEMIYGAFNTSSDGVLVAFDSLALGWQV